MCNQVFPGPGDGLSSTQDHELGQLYTDPTTGTIYKYLSIVAGTATVAGASGDVVFYNGTADTATTDLTDVVGSAAGVLQDAYTSGTVYGWVVVRGTDISLNTDIVAGAAGNALTHIGSNDLTLDVSAAVTDPVVAYVVDATGSANVITACFPL